MSPGETLHWCGPDCTHIALCCPARAVCLGQADDLKLPFYLLYDPIFLLYMQLEFGKHDVPRICICLHFYTVLAAGFRSFASLPAESQTTPDPQMPPFDHQPRPYSGIPKEEVLRLRKQHLSPGTC